MWELDHKEGWVPKNWCFWTVVLEKTLETPLDSKEIQPVNPKGNQPWIFIGRTEAEAEAPNFGHLKQRGNSVEKTLMLGKIECRRRRNGTEDQMVGWHHLLNGHEFEQTLGDSERQGSLECCSFMGCKEVDMTLRLNNKTHTHTHTRGFPGGTSGEKPTCQCSRYKRRGFNPWVQKIPWRKVWQATPIFLPRESHRQRSPVGYSS